MKTVQLKQKEPRDFLYKSKTHKQRFDKDIKNKG